MNVIGSICHIIKNPKNWNCIPTDKRLKPEYGGEILYKVQYGELDDYPDGLVPLDIYIRESILNKLISGEYTVERGPDFSIQIFDSNGNIIKHQIEGIII